MGLAGLEFERSWSNRVEENYDEVKTQFISIEDLIITKSKAGRPQDLIDVENLRLSLKRKESSDQAKVSEPEQKPTRKKARTGKRILTRAEFEIAIRRSQGCAFGLTR
jgi:predicted nucleotidyltransferase